MKKYQRYIVHLQRLDALFRAQPQAPEVLRQRNARATYIRMADMIFMSLPAALAVGKARLLLPESSLAAALNHASFGCR